MFPQVAGPFEYRGLNKPNTVRLPRHFQFQPATVNEWLQTVYATMDRNDKLCALGRSISEASPDASGHRSISSDGHHPSELSDGQKPHPSELSNGKNSHPSILSDKHNKTYKANLNKGSTQPVEAMSQNRSSSLQDAVPLNGDPVEEVPLSVPLWESQKPNHWVHTLYLSTDIWCALGMQKIAALQESCYT